VKTAFLVAVRDLAADRRRSIITMLAVAPIVAAYLILMGVADGLREGQEAGPTTNVLLVSPDALDPASGRLDPGVLDVAEQAVGREAASIGPVIFRPMRVDDKVLQLRAAPLDDWDPVHGLVLLRGSLPGSDADEIAITEGVATATGWQPGDVVEIYGTMFTITGLVGASGTKFASVWMSYDRADRLFEGAGGFQMVVVSPAPGVDPGGVRDRLASVADGRYEAFFEADLAAEQSARVGAAVDIATIATLIGIGALGFATFNLTALTLAERRRDVGIARSLGFSARAIAVLAALRSVLLAAGGYVIGGAAALIVTLATPPTTLRSLSLDVAVPGSAWAAAGAMCVIVSALGSIVAHRLVARRPITTLLDAP
jgi:hypothetical protein